MPGHRIPDSIARFLRAHIGSIEQLEVLVLLRATPDRAWTAPEVSGELRSSTMSIQARLVDLASKGFLVARQAEAGLSYRYAPNTEEARQLIDGLVDAYKERRLAVVELIYAEPGSDVLSFSDAFRITKKRGDE